MRARASIAMRGGALIEVLIAVTLMAVTALGVIAGQISMVRNESAATMREQAAFIADSVAEAMRDAVPDAAMLDQWKARAASVLPQCDVSVREQSGGVSLSVVRWAAPQAPASGAADAPAACGDAALPAGTACVAIAFARPVARVARVAGVSAE
jgi:Tfp pilus assembly protein PilV